MPSFSVFAEGLKIRELPSHTFLTVGLGTAVAKIGTWVEIFVHDCSKLRSEPLPNFKILFPPVKLYSPFKVIL